MQDNRFYEYASSMLVAAGHMITPSPMYINHSSNEALYIDSKKDVVISSMDRALLSSIDNVSLLMEVEWAGVVDELTEKVQIFSVTVNFSESSRSQEVADIHHLLQKFWNNNHSIVLFKNKNHFVFSFADDTKSHILSDWFEISDDYDDVVERFAIENISLHSCDEYFEDFIYAIAREYYVHPISLEEASYGMMPIDMMVPKPVTEGSCIYDDEITKEDIKTAIRDNLSYYENMYGYDYVAVRYEGTDDAVNYRNITDEIERISFELELIDENEEQFMPDMEYNDDLDEEYDDLDEFEDDEDIDPAIYDDPILMVKWLERHQKIADEEKRGITENKRVEAERETEAFTALVQQEQGRCEQVKETVVALERSNANSNQFGIDAEQNWSLAMEKRDFADKQRQEAVQLATENDNLVHIETQRKLDAQAQCQAQDEAKRIEAERREKELLEAEREHLEAERRKQEHRLESERIEAELREKKRLEAECLERERLEAERKAREEAEQRQLILDGLMRNHNTVPSQQKCTQKSHKKRNES